MANISLDFLYLQGFPQNDPGTELYSSYGLVNRRLIPNQGSIIGMTVQSESDIVSGQVLAKPTIDGIEVSDMALNLVLSSPNKMVYDAIEPNTPGFEFNEGQELGIKLFSSLDWNNDFGNIICTLFVNLND